MEDLSILDISIFGFFLWVELFQRSDLARRRRDVKWWKVVERRGRGRMCCETGQSSGKVENIKGNALVPDFNQHLSDS